MVYENRLRSFKVAGTVLIDLNDLDNLVRAGERTRPENRPTRRTTSEQKAPRAERPSTRRQPETTAPER